MQSEGRSGPYPSLPEQQYVPNSEEECDGFSTLSINKSKSAKEISALVADHHRSYFARMTPLVNLRQKSLRGTGALNERHSGIIQHPKF